MITHAAQNDVVISSAADAWPRYRAVVASDLLDAHGQVLDWLLGLVFDTLGAHHLHVRVLPSEACQVEHRAPTDVGSLN